MKYWALGFLSPPMLASRSTLAGTIPVAAVNRGRTNSWFRANEFLLIMFGPQASPVRAVDLVPPEVEAQGTDDGDREHEVRGEPLKKPRVLGRRTRPFPHEVVRAVPVRQRLQPKLAVSDLLRGVPARPAPPPPAGGRGNAGIERRLLYLV